MHHEYILNGETLSLNQLAERARYSRTAMLKRLKRMTPEEAVLGKTVRRRSRSCGSGKSSVRDKVMEMVIAAGEKGVRFSDIKEAIGTKTYNFMSALKCEDLVYIDREEDLATRLYPMPELLRQVRKEGGYLEWKKNH